MHRLVFATFGLGLTACADATLASSRDAQDSSFDEQDQAGDSEFAPEDVSYPMYWAIFGSLEVLPASRTVVGGSLELAMYGADGTRWLDDTSSQPCQWEIVDSEAPPPTAQLDLWSWWRLDVAPEPESSCPWSLPRLGSVTSTVSEAPIVLGFGAVPPTLVPALRASGLSNDLPVFGLYGMHPDGSQDKQVVFGVAGTESQFAGHELDLDTEESDEPSPLVFSLQTLVLMPTGFDVP